MNLINALIDQIKIDAPVQHVLVGAFCTAVVVDTDPPRCGLAATLRGEYHNTIPPVADAGKLINCSGKDLARMLHSTVTLEASIGMAALNALLEVDESCCSEANARDLILTKGKDRQVVVIGHFPFLNQVHQVASKCWVLELTPHEDELPANCAGDILPQADVVAITGTSIINHTFEKIITCCRPDSFTILLGGSVPLSPILFEYGINVIAGTRVVNIPEALQALIQGATFRQIPGKKLLTMPGEKKLIRKL